MSIASKFIFALSIFCCFDIQLRAQGNRGIPIVRYVNRDSVPPKDSIPQKDFYDVLKRLMGKKMPTVPHKDTITSKPTISVIPAIGYTLTTGFAVSLSGNMQFRL